MGTLLRGLADGHMVGNYLMAAAARMCGAPQMHCG